MLVQNVTIPVYQDVECAPAITSSELVDWLAVMRVTFREIVDRIIAIVVKHIVHFLWAMDFDNDACV